MEVVLGGMGVWAVRKIHNHRKKKRDAAEYDYTTASLRSVLSMLVHGVYFRDLDKFGDTLATFLGYQNGRAGNYGRRHWEPFRPTDQLNELELKALGLEFLLRRDPHPNQSAPDLAIVFRGTIPYNARDLAADLKISVALLHNSERIQRSQTLVWRVVQEFRRRFRGKEQICLAGHSLGGAVALHVGRFLVSQHGVAIDTHLFNPPLLTLVDIATLQAIPRPSASYNQRPGASYVQTVANPVGLSTLWMAMFPEDGGLRLEWQQFQKLEGWTPHFYLNPSDAVCQRYIKYYDKRHQMVTTVAQVVSPQSLVTRLFGKNAKYIADVVPSADLYISYLHHGNLLPAHSLRQWHKYTDADIQLHRVQARLLPHARHLAHAYEAGKNLLLSPRGHKQS